MRLRPAMIGKRTVMTATRASRRFYGNRRAFLFSRDPRSGQYASNIPATTARDMQNAYPAGASDYAGGEARLQGRLAELLRNDVQRRKALAGPVPTHPVFPNPGAPPQLGRVAKAETENVAETVARFLRKKAKL